MLELGELSEPLHRECGRAAASSRLAKLITIGGDPARALGEAAIDAGMPRAAVTHFDNSTDAAPAIAAQRDVRRRGAGQGIARHAHRSRGGAPDGGVRLMLYHLLLSFYPQVSVFNVARYITFRTAAASMTALVISLVMGPWLIRRLRDFQIGQVIRQEGPESHRAKAGTPTMGGLLILAAALTPTLLWADLTNIYVWIAVRHDRGVRRHRLPRRLPEDHAPLVGRTGGALQARTAARGRPAGRPRVDVARRPEPLQHAADLPVLQAADSRHRLAATCRSPRSSSRRGATPST